MNLLKILRFNRFLSGWLASRLARTSVSPNAVTAAGLLTGLVAAWAMTFGTRASMLAAVALLHLAFIFDSTDGDLARMTGRQSRFGRWFDVISDLVVDLAIWSSLLAACSLREMGSPFLDRAFAVACVGSALNFFLILRERQTGSSFHVADVKDDTRKKSRFFVLLESLSHNGISIAFAYAVAATGRPDTFLLCAAFFMTVLWIARIAVNFRSLVPDHIVRTLGKAAVWILGGWILWHTLAVLSWSELGGLLRESGHRLPLVLAVFPLICLLHTLGFRRLFSPEARKRVGFWKLYWIYLRGDSLNKVTPFADLGGEPLKVRQLQASGNPVAAESVEAVYVCRITLVFSEMLLMAVGTVLAMSFHPSPAILAVGLTAMGVSAAFLGILLFSKRELAGFLSRMAGLGAPAYPPHLRKFFTERTADVVGSIFWNWAAWAFFFLEIYLTLRLFHAKISLLDAFMMHAVLRAVQTATFFIPVNLGSQEGGLAFLASHIGLSSAHGVALSLTKRLRQWLFAAFALIASALLTSLSKNKSPGVAGA